MRVIFYTVRQHLFASCCLPNPRTKAVKQLGTILECPLIRTPRAQPFPPCRHAVHCDGTRSKAHGVGMPLESRQPSPRPGLPPCCANPNSAMECGRRSLAAGRRQGLANETQEKVWKKG
eukprot:364347-Chlamydomonas_euryale.AAC.11